MARGKYSKAISDRSGMEFPYNEMVKEWNGSFVHRSEFERKHPQLELRTRGGDAEGLLAARNDIGKLNIAPITVPAQAIKRDSATFGTILSIASCDKSRGNIAEISIHILPGADKNLSGVISSPEADHIDPTTIKKVIKYLSIFWFNGCEGIFIIFSFLAKH